MPRGWSVPSLEIRDISCFFAAIVVTSTIPQFFDSSCLNVQIFHSFEMRFRHFVYSQLHVISIFCVSSSLTAGGGFPAPSIYDFL